MIDTLTFSRDLEQAKMPREQIDVLARAFANAGKELATKDFVRQEGALLRAELRQEMAELRVELRQEMAELRQEMAGLRLELKQEMAGLRTDLQTIRGDMLREQRELAWKMGALLTGQAAVIVALVKLL